MIFKSNGENEKTFVISVELGLGEVKGMLKMYDGLHDHIEVYYENEDLTKYYSMNNLNMIRSISTEVKMKKALVELGDQINSETFEFDTSSYSRGIKKIDVFYIVHTIASLLSHDELSDGNKFVLEQYTKSLITEVAHVYDIERQEARGIVFDYLKCA